HVRPDREDEAEPEQREDEFRDPLDPHRLEGEGAGEHGEAGGGVLDAGRDGEIDAAAKALLVERAEGDRDEPSRDDSDADEVRGADINLLGDDERDAAKAKDKAQPLAAADRLAEEEAAKRGGEERLHPDDERGETGADAERHAEIDAA